MYLLPRLTGRPAIYASIAIALAGIFVILLGSFEINYELNLAASPGKHGYFIAQYQACGVHLRAGPPRCYWFGEFERADRLMIREGVIFQGNHRAFVQGTVVHAVDTGDPVSVYQPQHRATQLATPVLTAAAGAFIFLYASANLVRHLTRRRRVQQRRAQLESTAWPG
jgi:hypothetical protein